MDDAAGRKAARRLGLTVIGFVGVLVAAKRAGLVPAVGPLLELARRNGYWLADELIAAVRKLTQE